MKLRPAARATTSQPSDTSLSPHQTAAAIPSALAGFDSYPDSAYVRLPVVCALFQISSATAWRWSKSGRLHAPRRLSEGVTAWNVGELRKALSGDSWK